MPKERRTRAAKAPSRAPETLARLSVQHPQAKCELSFRDPFELLVSVVLSAQTTDAGVNRATPALFDRYPDAKALGAAQPSEVEPYVASLGFFRQKAKAVVGLSRALVEHHGGKVPRSLQALVQLPGVGRKTANVILGVVWNAPEGVVVDTHVQRLAQRLGWSKHADPEKIEKDLCAILPRSEWDHAAHVLIFHGRRCCTARKPDCAQCSVSDVCPVAFDAENVGRKANKLPPKSPGRPGAVRRTPTSKTPSKAPRQKRRSADAVSKAPSKAPRPKRRSADAVSKAPSKAPRPKRRSADAVSKASSKAAPKKRKAAKGISKGVLP